MCIRNIKSFQITRKIKLMRIVVEISCLKPQVNVLLEHVRNPSNKIQLRGNLMFEFFFFNKIFKKIR